VKISDVDLGLVLVLGLGLGPGWQDFYNGTTLKMQQKTFRTT